MQPFSAPGMFWEPSSPERQVPGRVEFSSDGIRVTVVEPLREFVMPESGVALGGWHRRELPMLHGRTHDGQDVSLLDAAGLVMEGPFDRSEEEYRCAFGLLGGHVDRGDCESLTFEFDVLKAWVDPEPPARSTGFNTWEVGFRRETLAACTLPQGELELQVRSQGMVGERVEIERVVALKLTCPVPLPLGDLIEQVVRCLQDMLITVIGMPVRLTQVLTRPVGAASRDDLLNVFFEALQPAEGVGATAAGLQSYNSPLLWRYNDPAVPFSVFVPEWFVLQEQLGEAVTLLCGPFYASFMYNEHRYASFFQAAESLSKLYYSGTQRAREQHKKRVARVCEILESEQWDPDDVEWARGLLGQRNDKPARQLLGQLVKDAFGVGAALERLPNDFVRRAVYARNGVSHSGLEPVPPAERYWLGQALLWLVRFHLLLEMGLPPEPFGKTVACRERFRFGLEQLKPLT